MKCVCLAMRFVPLRAIGMKLGTVVGGKDLLFQGHQRSKVRSNFKYLRWSLNLVRIMLT